jgi:hypothetical protein
MLPNAVAMMMVVKNNNQKTTTKKQQKKKTKFPLSLYLVSVNNWLEPSLCSGV